MIYTSCEGEKKGLLRIGCYFRNYVDIPGLVKFIFNRSIIVASSFIFVNANFRKQRIIDHVMCIESRYKYNRPAYYLFVIKYQIIVFNFENTTARMPPY